MCCVLYPLLAAPPPVRGSAPSCSAVFPCLDNVINNKQQPGVYCLALIYAFEVFFKRKPIKIP